MTIEELKKKIEAIDVLGSEAKLTIRVNSNDGVKVKDVGDQYVLIPVDKGDIEVITCNVNEEKRLLTIRSAEDGFLFLDIEDYLYPTDVVEVVINVLKVCHEYMEDPEV